MWRPAALKQLTLRVEQLTGPTRLQALVRLPFRQRAFCTQHLSFSLSPGAVLVERGMAVVAAQAA
jgi:hypothetical protein